MLHHRVLFAELPHEVLQAVGEEKDLEVGIKRAPGKQAIFEARQLAVAVSGQSLPVRLGPFHRGTDERSRQVEEIASVGESLVGFEGQEVHAVGLHRFIDLRIGVEGRLLVRVLREPGAETAFVLRLVF